MKITKNWLAIRNFLREKAGEKVSRIDILRHTKLTSKALSQTLWYAVKTGAIKRDGYTVGEFVFYLPAKAQAWRANVLQSIAENRPAKQPSEAALTEKLMDAIHAIVLKRTASIIEEKNAEIKRLTLELRRKEKAGDSFQARLFPGN